MAFKLPPLPYATDALQPYIDAKTMEIHHGKHHNGYTTKLNAALAGTPVEGKTIDEVLSTLDMDNAALRNNGGGFYNHCLFWEIMGPDSGQMSKELSGAISAGFGSFEDFKTSFSTAAATRFGSGWAWLCVKNGGSLEVCSTSNQDNPLMPDVGCGGKPILGLDVWEHAYYLNYQNRRPDYIDAFFNVINWSEVSRRYSSA